jgi:hypothetical protein
MQVVNAVVDSNIPLNSEQERELGAVIASYNSLVDTKEAVDEAAQDVLANQGGDLAELQAEEARDQAARSAAAARGDAEAQAAESRFEEIDDQVRARVAEETNRDKIRMAQQCVLMTLLENLADRNTLLSYDPRIIHLTGDPAYLVNLLAEKPGERAMTKIRPEQFAELVPYVRIYKVRRNTANQEQAEFIFNSAVTPDEVPVASAFGDQFNRGRGVGLKSIDWTFDGSDPFTAGRSIQVNLEFFFQSYGELVRDRVDPNGIPYKFLDLILMSDCAEANKMRQDKATDPSAAPEAFQTKTVRRALPRMLRD